MKKQEQRRSDPSPCKVCSMWKRGKRRAPKKNLQKNRARQPLLRVYAKYALSLFVSIFFTPRNNNEQQLHTYGGHRGYIHEIFGGTRKRTTRRQPLLLMNPKFPTNSGASSLCTICSLKRFPLARSRAYCAIHAILRDTKFSREKVQDEHRYT